MRMLRGTAYPVVDQGGLSDTVVYERKNMSNSKENPTDGKTIGPERTPGKTFETQMLLGIKEVAVLLNCSPRHCARLAKTSRMPQALKLGGLRRWHKVTIDQWLADGCPSVGGGV